MYQVCLDPNICLCWENQAIGNTHPELSIEQLIVRHLQLGSEVLKCTVILSALADL